MQASFVKRQLIRIVRSSEGVMIDPSGKLLVEERIFMTRRAVGFKALKGSLASCPADNHPGSKIPWQH
jgi:hypothetical protein